MNDDNDKEQSMTDNNPNDLLHAGVYTRKFSLIGPSTFNKSVAITWRRSND